MSESEQEGRVLIYDGAVRGEVVKFDFEPEAETIWADVEQMAEVFGVDRTVISRHVRNIYTCGELQEAATCAKNAQVREEGGRLVTRQVKKYNLDMIISVGYRVNSAKATKFRIWANKVLKDYIVNGAAVNQERLLNAPEERLKKIENTMGMVRRLLRRNELAAPEANGVLEIIAKYTESIGEVGQKGQEKLVRLGKNFAQKKKVGETEILRLVEELRASEGESEIFGKVKEAGIFEKVVEIFGDSTMDGTEKKAAELLYTVANEKPFYEGNKRIAALLFVIFLTMRDLDLATGNETKISDRALAALTLLISEAEESERELLIELVEKLLR